SFSAEVGIDIRAYEQQQLQSTQIRSEKQTQLSSQLSRLRSQLDYQRAHDLSDRIATLQNKVEQDQSALAKVEQQEARSQAEIELLAAKLDERQAAMRELSSSIEDRDLEIKELQKRLSRLIDDSGDQRRISANLESQIDKLYAQRHQIYQECEDTDVVIRFLGNSSSQSQRSRRLIDDEDEDDGSDEDDEDPSELSSSLSSPSASQTTPSSQLELYHNEDRLRPDFASLPRKYKSVNMGTEEIEEINLHYQQQVRALEANLAGLEPNLRAETLLDGVQQRLHTMDDAHRKAQDELRTARAEFEEVERERVLLFRGAFDAIAKNINAIYAELTRSRTFPKGGTAELALEDKSKPFLHGISYHVQPPGKVFSEIQHLSGGEKTLAALALRFAIHSFSPSPFFVLDEVDAALDAKNVTQLAQYITRSSESHSLQWLVISLKPSFFEHADSLVGICRNVAQESSDVLTYNLRDHFSSAADV
ncbi:MAG: hypothetical protein Q8P67_21960, partial [archaeon]|nr:hypothetical protein [archaeon]